MKPLQKPLRALLSCVLISSATLQAQDRALIVAAYEEPPVLSATEILKPEYLSGTNFKVAESVPTYSGANRYVIESNYGIYHADSNDLLIIRVEEIQAIEKLKNVSRSEEYTKALERAAKSPVALAKNLAKDPVGTVSGVPKGVWKFMNRVGQSAKEVTSGRERSQYDEGAGKDLIGFSKAKRQVAAQLGIDPYSTNEALQRELNGLSWTSFAGNSTVDLLMLPVGGAAKVAYQSVNLTTDTRSMLRDLSPSDLRRENLGRMIKVGVPKATGEAFLNGTAFSPWHQTHFIDSLLQLDGVTGRTDFIRTVTAIAENENDALFCQNTAKLMARIHKNGTRLKRIIIENTFPVCIAEDGSRILALQWDYAAWTQGADQFLTEMQRGDGKGKPATCVVAISGVASERAKQELQTRGIRLQERLDPGPLR